MTAIHMKQAHAILNKAILYKDATDFIFFAIRTVSIILFIRSFQMTQCNLVSGRFELKDSYVHTQHALCLEFLLQFQCKLYET